VAERAGAFVQLKRGVAVSRGFPAIVIGQGATQKVSVGVMTEMDAFPGTGDVVERLKEVGAVAVGSKGREGIAERVEVALELRAVLRFERIEPAAAGEEPVACVAVRGCSLSGQQCSKRRRIIVLACFRQIISPVSCVKSKHSTLEKEVYMEIDFFRDRVHSKPHVD
jgi:hypothetical protein